MWGVGGGGGDREPSTPPGSSRATREILSSGLLLLSLDICFFYSTLSECMAKYSKDPDVRYVIGGAMCFLSLFLLLSWTGYRLVAAINFDRLCKGYLKNAADANTIEQAERRLAIAVQYIEDKNLDHGYTSILWQTPEEDVGFWARNLKSALAELRELPVDSTPLEKSNMLIKLRETLLDQNSKGTTVTVPQGISIFPYNLLVAVGASFSLLIGVCGLFFVFKPEDGLSLSSTELLVVIAIVALLSISIFTGNLR